MKRFRIPLTPASKLPVRFGILAKSFCAVGLALLGLVCGAPLQALAQTTVHPKLFVLPASDFPSGSQIVRSGVEGNRRLVSDDARHFGLPPAAMQRITGYYMDAVEGDPAGQHAYTSYLVSIFHSSRQARLAFDERWDTWFEADYNSTPPAAPVAVGDSGAEALFHTLDSSQPQLTELLFRRGAVLVEVYQGTVNGGPTDTQLHAFWSIATRLDAIAARHPRGV